MAGEQDNELPDDFPDVVYVTHPYRSESLIVNREPWNFKYHLDVMYRKEGVSPDELDTDNSRGLLLDRIAELTGLNSSQAKLLAGKIKENIKLKTQLSESVDPALVKELIEAANVVINYPGLDEIAKLEDAVLEIGK